MCSLEVTRQKMNSLVADTEEMLSLAQSEQWEALVDLEARRHSDLEAFFDNISEEDKNGLSEELRLFINRLMELDQQVLVLSGKARIEAAAEIQQLKAGSQAVDAYNKNQV